MLVHYIPVALSGFFSLIALRMTASISSPGSVLRNQTGETGCFRLHPHLGVVVRRDEDDRRVIVDRTEPLAQVQP